MEKTCKNCLNKKCPDSGKNKPVNKEVINGFTWIHICAQHLDKE